VSVDLKVDTHELWLFVGVELQLDARCCSGSLQPVARGRYFFSGAFVSSGAGSPKM
jgi:hypothetical protein